MNFAVRPTPSALNDAVTIGERIRDNGFPMNAERWVDELMQVLAELAVFPESWRLAPENDAIEDYEIQHRTFGNYRILFTIQAQQVFVLHIRWGGRKSATKDELMRAVEEMEKMKHSLKGLEPLREDQKRSAKEHFEKMSEAVEMLNTAQAIREGINDMKAGRSRPASEFFDEMRQQHPLSERRQGEQEKPERLLLDGVESGEPIPVTKEYFKRKLAELTAQGLEQAQRGELVDGEAVFDRLERELDAQEHLEQLLLEGINSGQAEPWTADDWTELRQHIQEHRRGKT